MNIYIHIIFEYIRIHSCHTKNDTPALSAPKSIAISQSDSARRGVSTGEWRLTLRSMPPAAAGVDGLGAGMARV
jgi:hypothetical protein